MFLFLVYGLNLGIQSRIIKSLLVERKHCQYKSNKSKSSNEFYFLFFPHDSIGLVDCPLFSFCCFDHLMSHNVNRLFQQQLKNYLKSFARVSERVMRGSKSCCCCFFLLFKINTTIQYNN